MDAIYCDDEAARAHLEALLWPDGPICPRCGVVDNATLLKGKSTRPGVYKCRDCASPFTVTVGTIYERSHIPLHKWVYATHLLTASKKGMSALQLHRMLGFGSYRTAWFMVHRIREAMKDESPAPLGGKGKVIEADETYYGKVAEPATLRYDGKPFRADDKKGRKGVNYGPANKRRVVALVERGGKARVFHVGNASMKSVVEILDKHADRASRLHTDESHLYKRVGQEFAAHETVNHGREECARGDVTTNTVEGFFAVFKRGMIGVYQHCDEKYLARYLTEFEFRYNNRIALGVDDKERATLATKGAKGKRLTLRRPQGEQATP